MQIGRAIQITCLLIGTSMNECLGPDHPQPQRSGGRLLRGRRRCRGDLATWHPRTQPDGNHHNIATLIADDYGYPVLAPIYR